MTFDTSYKKRGFTLVEMLVYIGILAIISVVTVTAIIGTIRAFSSIRLSRDITSSATTALERIVREVRGATSVDVGASVFGSANGKLVLNTLDTGGIPNVTTFTRAGSGLGELRVTVGAADQGNMLSSNVTANELIFSHITTTNSEAIRIYLDVSGTRGNITRNIHLYDTVVVRGSY